MCRKREILEKEKDEEEEDQEHKQYKSEETLKCIGPELQEAPKGRR